jgi:sensor histidine kinase regulating citrate/malate metabolism
MLPLLFTVFLLIMSLVYATRVGDLYDNLKKSTSQLVWANQQIIIQREYYEALSIQMNEIREMKHDVRHFIGVMSRMSEEGKNDELRMFLREYNVKTETEKLPVFCENIAANAIIGYYYTRAKKYDICFNSRCKIDENISMNDMDLCIVFGNALENAIDACRRMEDSKMHYVSIETATNKGQRLCKVKNSYDSHFSIKDGCYASSKEGRHHGLGIRNIEKVIKHYGGILKIEHNEKEFILMAAIPKK